MSEGSERLGRRVPVVDLRRGDTIVTDDGRLVRLGQVRWEPVDPAEGPVVAVTACVEGSETPSMVWVPTASVLRVHPDLPR